jgi:hypothetical protein
VSVREAAVELLAKHIVSDPALAEDYFEVLAEASRVSGRSRAAAGWVLDVGCWGGALFGLGEGGGAAIRGGSLSIYF